MKPAPSPALRVLVEVARAVAERKAAERQQQRGKMAVVGGGKKGQAA